MATQSSPPNPLPRPSTRKILVVCCDGTWEAGDHVSKDDSSYQTNITRMCHALADDGTLSDGTPAPQIVYYQSGVGANVPTALGRAFAGAVGYGVNENILSAYNFLVNNYTPGDELCLFGFSRGSFTCRSLAGMISKFGILKQEHAGEWFAGIWDRYQGNAVNIHWNPLDDHLTHTPSIKVVGCWDTVGSLGIPETRLTKLFNLNRKHAFHDTELSPKIQNAFHALALDEHRKSFSPTLWYLPAHKEENLERRTRLKQCWFAGVHTDVGRGYDDHVPGDIADITFAWMVDQCRGHLEFNESVVREMMKKGDSKKLKGNRAIRQREERENKAKNWGMAYLHDSMDRLIFKIGGSRTRTPGQYIFSARQVKYDSTKVFSDRNPSGSGFVTDSKVVPNATPEAQSWYWRFWVTVSSLLGSPPEDIAKLAPVWTSEFIHPSVRVRMMKDDTYDPPALRGYKPFYNKANNRWTWVKEWHAANGEIRRKKLYEHQIEDPSFALHTVTKETLEFGVGLEVPLPPRRKKSWLPFW